jgi:nucleoside diphosphate kinase
LNRQVAKNAKKLWGKVSVPSRFFVRGFYMVLLKQLLTQDAVTLSVYSPDCIQSRLWGNLDNRIAEVTGLQVGYRRWIYHDVNSVERFYRSTDDEEPTPQTTETSVERGRRLEDVPAEKLQSGHLVVRLLISGPSLVTIWHGDNAIQKLLALKGRTHPAQAEPNTIRGSFWCDNAVCNLIHSSDSASEAERELKAVGLGNLLDAEPQMGRLAQMRPEAQYSIAHSGIVSVCDVVNRVLEITSDMPLLEYELPQSGAAAETMQYLTSLLQTVAVKLSGQAVAGFIEAYLRGDIVAVTAAMKQMPVTKWEHFVIQCSTLSRDRWLQQ